MPLSINALPSELLAKIFIEGTQTELDEEEGAWEDQESVDGMDFSDAESESSVSLVATRGSRGQVRGGGAGAGVQSPATPSNEFPTLVSHVCRHWRLVALDAPMLWTTLDFAEGPPYEKSKVWLERSKDCDLDITVDHSEDELATETETAPATYDLRRIMHLISPHVQRWRMIHISVSRKEQMYMVLYDFLYQIGPALRLRSLSLYDNSDDDGSDSEEETFYEVPSEGMIFNDHAPLLSEVCLWGVTLQWRKATFLRELEALELAYHDHTSRPSWEDFATLLLASPDLKALSIADSGPNPGDDLQIQWPEETIPLLSLHKLSVAFVTPMYLDELLCRLEIPSLEELEMDLDGPGTGNLLTSITGKKKNLLRNLRKLKIGALETTPPEVVTLYTPLNSLLSLCLNLSYLNPSYLTLLHEKPSTYLPQLEELVIMGLDDENSDNLKEVIKKRAEVGNKLKKLVLCNQDDIDDADLEWFKGQVVNLELIDNLDDEEVTDSDSEAEGMTIEVDDLWGLGPEDGEFPDMI